jgi:hypothetical protein
MNKAAINICVQDFVGTRVFKSFGWLSKSTIAGAYSKIFYVTFFGDPFHVMFSPHGTGGMSDALWQGSANYTQGPNLALHVHSGIVCGCLGHYHARGE